MRRTLILTLVQRCSMIAVLATITSCGVDSKTLYELRDQVQAVSQSVSSGAQEVEDSESEPSVGKRFLPPYPDRENPFEYPGGSDPAAAQANSSGEAGKVKVIGFANVGEPRVVIRIGESIYSPRVGQKIGNLEVISIRPPQAEFRYGTFSWTASLYDRENP